MIGMAILSVVDFVWFFLLVYVWLMDLLIDRVADAPTALVCVLIRQEIPFSNCWKPRPKFPW